MSQAYDYVITLKQRNYRAFDGISQLLIFISLAVFAYTAYLYPSVRIQYSVLIAIVIAALVYLKIKTKGDKYIPYYRFALTLTSLGWFFEQYGNIWIGGLLILVAFLERQVKFPEEVGFSEEGVTFNSFPKKAFAWNDISNAILKDGLLTVDLPKNKLFQKEVESNVNPILETEFNQFCSKHLNNTVHRTS